MMKTQQADKSHAERRKRERRQLGDLIGKHVMQALGESESLHAVQVRRLWADHYRVNVLVGVDATSAKIAHSYFLVADDRGNVVASRPEITKQY